jgi:GT2 family glycosyltransferase
LVNNEQKFVSYGFNKAFPLSKGKYVTLMGAHAQYPTNFFNTGVSSLEKNECDSVGGPLLQVGKTETGKAIAYAMSTKFGVGGTEFRTETKKMYVDSVAFAIYKREIFEKVGLLDEELIRNQDDEFHYRINAAGYRILMVPEMACVYYVRNTISGLFKQYFQYGLYKPRVFKKVRKGFRLRHMIPSLFVLYTWSLPLIYLLPMWVVFLAIYIIFLFYYSFKNKLPFLQKLISLLVFPTLHIAYGLGFLLGLKKMF